MALSVIIVLYVAIGLMSAAGSVFISKKLFSAKIEQIFFALFLIPIAGFYLAFTAYFGDKGAWRFETGGVIAIRCLGPSGYSSASCAHNWIPPAWPLGCASRDSCSWRRWPIRRSTSN